MKIIFQSNYATHVITVSIERRGHSRCHQVTEWSRNRAAWHVSRYGFTPERSEDATGARVVYTKGAA